MTKKQLTSEPTGGRFEHRVWGVHRKARKLLAKLADDVGMPIHYLALLWCNANPNVSTVILGASKLSQLKENLKALDHKSKMTPEVLAKIEEIMGNKPVAAQRF